MQEFRAVLNTRCLAKVVLSEDVIHTFTEDFISEKVLEWWNSGRDEKAESVNIEKGTAYLMGSIIHIF